MAQLSKKTWSTRRGAFTLGAVVAAVAMLGLVSAGPSTAAAPASAGYNRAPNEDEYALLALANMARSQPSLDGGREPTQPPYVWNDDLAKAARFHTWDMITHNCAQHDSCNGEAWWRRVQHFYPGWSSLGENIGGGVPLIVHTGWMASPGHRAEILSGSQREFGAGLMYDDANASHAIQGTEDFGSRGEVTIPPIPSGTVLQPRFWDGTESGSVWHWQVLVNFYDANGKTATAVKAYVDGAPVSLSRLAGTNTNGAWSAFVNAPGWNQNPSGLPSSYCKRVFFQITRSDALVFRYPATDDIGLGFAAGCEFRAPHGGTPPPGDGGGGGAGAPEVTISAPADNARVSGTVTITASATDDSKVAAIEVFVDGRRLVRRRVGSVTRKWNAGMASVRPGAHTITVKAYDDAGNVGTASITVTK